MKKHGKKYRKVAEKIENSKSYDVDEAVQILKDNVEAGFDHTIEVHMKLGVDPKHADQVVRGSVVLPNGTGKKVRILAFAKGPNAEAAIAAGADFVGGDDMVAKIQEGWLDFDKVVATPDMMPVIGKVARVLGPRGLMPNPKTGTVTPNIGKAIEELNAGKVSFRVDKSSNIHGSVGKLSFEAGKMVDNIKTYLSAVVKAKPAAAKGEYVKGAYLSTTMSPSLAISKSFLK